MATVTAYYDIDMSIPISNVGYLTTATGSQVTKTDGYYSWTYWGNFTFDSSNKLSGGTVTSYTQASEGSLDYSVSNISIDVKALDTYLTSGNTLGLEQYLLAGNDILNGSNYQDKLLGMIGDDIIYGNGGSDYIDGGSGNDSINGGSGNDLIDGGSGIDTAIFSGKLEFAYGTRTDTGFLVTTASGGTDTVTNVERLQFDDKTLAFDVNGTAGQVYRVYQAAFDRKPDSGGLGDWIYAMEHDGLSLKNVATGFIESPEFKALYGVNPTTTELVNRLYENVLHRAPEQAGLEYWTHQLDAGYQEKNEVLTGFSESLENQAQLIGVIQNGIEYIQHHG